MTARRLVREELRAAGPRRTWWTPPSCWSASSSRTRWCTPGPRSRCTPASTAPGCGSRSATAARSCRRCATTRDLAGTGRGLRLVAARWSTAGASDATSAGKTVWFELADGARTARRRTLTTSQDGGAAGAAAAATPTGAVQVELLNVPLLLHVAWHQHAEALLREYLLVSLGDDDDLDVGGLQAHAAVQRGDRAALRAPARPRRRRRRRRADGRPPVEPGVSSAREVLRGAAGVAAALPGARRDPGRRDRAGRRRARS